jgi:hypothetical protein
MEMAVIAGERNGVPRVHYTHELKKTEVVLAIIDRNLS